MLIGSVARLATARHMMTCAIVIATVIVIAIVKDSVVDHLIGGLFLLSSCLRMIVRRLLCAAVLV